MSVITVRRIEIDWQCPECGLSGHEESDPEWFNRAKFEAFASHSAKKPFCKSETLSGTVKVNNILTLV